jgi:tetratricopeptide (TPR) repeat protein
MVSSAQALNADSVFVAAGENYEKQLYPEALADYISLEDAGVASAAVYYNIGNCYFELGELGYAILYYLRAQKLDPGDEDIANNLAFARQYMSTTLEGVEINPVTEFFDGLVQPFRLNTMAWIASVLFILLILFYTAVVYFGFGGIVIRWSGYTIIVLLLMAAGLTTYKYRTDYLKQEGVIVASEAKIYSGPDESHDLEFTGSFGLVFEVERREDNYYLVMFENKRKGWINKDLVELI